jgi:hypothetical protein
VEEMKDNKIETAEKIINITERKNCKECPLDDICDFLVMGDSDFDSICDELHFFIDNERG